jgi:hypothetical protein
MNHKILAQSTKLKVASWTNGDLWPFTDNQTFIDAKFHFLGKNQMLLPQLNTFDLCHTEIK